MSTSVFLIIIQLLSSSSNVHCVPHNHSTIIILLILLLFLLSFLSFPRLFANSLHHDCFLCEPIFLCQTRANVSHRVLVWSAHISSLVPFLLYFTNPALTGSAVVRGCCRGSHPITLKKSSYGNVDR